MCGRFVILMSVLLAFCLVVSKPVAAQTPTRYAITNLLDSLPGVNPTKLVSEALSINDNCQVVGYYRDFGSYWVNERGFVWSPNSRVLLLKYDKKGDNPPWFGDPVGAVPHAINNRGQITGNIESVLNFYGYTYPCIWNAVTGDYDRLSFPDHYSGTFGGSVTCINSSGQAGGATGNSATLWDANGKVVPSGFPLALSTIRGINESGQICGDSAVWDSGTYQTHVFRYQWNALTAQDINPSGYDQTQALAINNSGYIVGVAHHRGSTTYSVAVVWSPTNQIQELPLSYSLATAINDSGQVVGQAGPGPDQFAFLWSANTGPINLNDQVIGGGDWVLRSANGINNRGQIVGLGEYKGQQRAFLLTPVESGTDLPSSSIHLIADEDNSGPNPEREVSGIVCDNLGQMSEDLKDRIEIRLTDYPNVTDMNWSLSSGNANTNNTGYVRLGTNNHIYYYPPDEFNDNQVPTNIPQDVTKSSHRSVTLTLHFTADGQRYVINKPIVLARPPVVLVHGINSGPDAWNPFITKITGMGLEGNEGYAANQEPPLAEIPFVTVNHKDPISYSGDLRNGNGPVEIGALLLSERIAKTLSSVRSGDILTDSDENHWNLIPKFNQQHMFKGYQGIPLSIRRVDVIAWSYGGVITRWYIASQGKDPSGMLNPLTSWYRRGYPYSPVQVPAYGDDIRKVITLGSMWRGVPFVNYANEVVFSEYPATSRRRLGDAPFIATFPFPITYSLDAFMTGLDGSDQNSLFYPATILRIKAPSMEVIAVNSPWMCQLVYGSPLINTNGKASGPAAPFNGNIAYGSVAGDDSFYKPELLTFLDSADLYVAVHLAQRPSWFPYLRLEYTDFTERNYHDGIVPLWSAAIPGSYKVAPCTHEGYLTNADTLNYAVQWLNNVNLPTGVALNAIWNDPASAVVQSADGSKTWQIESQTMAPYPQSDLYPQINGIGRIHSWAFGQPDTLGKPATPFLPTYVVGPLIKTGDTYVATLQIKNIGPVLATGVEVTGATLTVGSRIALTSTPLPYVLGLADRTLYPKESGQKWVSDTFTLAFPASVGTSGATAIVSLTARSHYLSGSETVLRLRVTLP